MGQNGWKSQLGIETLGGFLCLVYACVCTCGCLWNVKRDPVPLDTAAAQSPDPFPSCLSSWEAAVLLSSSICSTSGLGFINRECCKCQPLIKSALLSALAPASPSRGRRTTRRAPRA